MRLSSASNPIIRLYARIMYKLFADRSLIEISPKTKIGYGLYIGHPHSITINPKAIIGNNCNIHRSVLIGQQNRGRNQGTPVIGNNVWIGINAAIVGKVTIGDDVMIAPNTFINCDIPSHSVVFGNPCIIKYKDNATEGYINRQYQV